MSQMITTTLTVNGKRHTVTALPDTPLLWVLREQLKLTGTKFGCGAGQCGACTVHIDGKPMRPACNADQGCRRQAASPRSKGCRRTRAIRCRKRGSPSRCRSAATASPARSCAPRGCSRKIRRPTREQIVEYMSTNICRCGTYQRIVRAIERAAKEAHEP